ncbi:hypothetical protein B0I33_10122 [Prauserella shujinwangii]|uniref:DUF86 domain-containing protein n=1 Tax=Prauserella shujinwangii TaxID=1453103 RepID=A0A2T0M290_9PSEU|nr:hypothetical protein [Prauserella shujinwangii]PRX50871.1 hypothetical protein B0I33_10122 [Prauserella shujinwangii]
MTSGGTTAPAELVDHARAVLAGRRGIPAAQRTRAAAILARQALEDTTRRLCTAAGADLPGANERSRLIVLRWFVGEGAADLAGAAWWGLSRLCHHHAYELTPTAGEVAHLVDQVASLIDALPGASGAGTG